MRVLAIADIHGCLESFRALLTKIDFQKEDFLILLGDYIDRGVNSKGVIDYIITLQRSGYNIQCLKGNHEEMLLQTRVNINQQSNWLSFGGRETLRSFDVSHIFDIPNFYIRWLENLPHYYEHESFIFVHAGLKFKSTDPMANYEAMIWIRDWYESIDYEWLGDKIIIHGHTPIDSAEIKNLLEEIDTNQYLGIDAGCVFGRHLCAVDLTNNLSYFQQNIDGRAWRIRN